MPTSGQLYKVKLASGRILGPLDLDRIRLLILKNQIVGTETAREYPKGDWVDINSLSLIGELLVARVEGRLGRKEDHSPATAVGYSPILGDSGKTQVLPGAKPFFTDDEKPSEPRPLETLSELEIDDEAEKTVVAVSGAAPPDDDRTRVDPVAHNVLAEESPVILDFPEPSENQSRRISNEKTVVFQRSKDPTHCGTNSGGFFGRGGSKNKIFEALKGIAVAVALGMLGYEIMGGDQSQQSRNKWEAVRPKLPDAIQGKPQPEESGKLYAEAMREYVLDHVTGYENAAKKLRQAASLDITNVKALAMLASSYINLIDSSNKDENYFSVITKLIDMSRAKNVSLPETVIAEVEFFITINKPEAAQNRIVEFTKNREIDLSMFYYIGLSFFHRGDAQTAARYLGQIPDNKVFSAKVFYLRGRVAEKLNDVEAALGEYQKAVKFNPAHAKSYLKVTELLSKKGRLKDAAGHLDYLVTHGRLLAPKDLALSYYYHAQLSQLYNKADVALGDMERAVKLDADNHDFQLELYSLRAKAGDLSIKSVQKEARMYFFLSEGEKVLRFGKYHDALVQFMQAGEANPTSPLPLVKMGDMFRLQNDLSNSLIHYRKAAEKAPNNIQVWSKYINALIQNYEWDEAKKAMDRFRNLPVPQSAIDKAAADWYSKQGQHAEAQVYYKKAMARETVDPDVYIAYAKSLMATRNFKEAPFFFALALRFDPLSTEAILGTAKCIAETDGVDRAISMLQDELSKSNRASAEILTAVAEFDVQKGEWELAQQNVDQARAADPDYAGSYRMQARIFLNKENLEKDALDKALGAYQSYVERNPSDAQGYLEKYNIYLKKMDYEKANDELSHIYAIFPKYPKLHFYQGWLLAAQGNHRGAAEEYEKELLNNPNHVTTIICLGKERLELGQLLSAKTKDGREVLGAQALFNKAMQLQPSNSEAKHQAGYAAYVLKNFAAAVALYSGALQIDKANPLIYKRLGMAYREMGDGQNAAQAFRKYLEMEPDAPDKAAFERYR
ncbi:tetratricopeptide repeat protein [Bdellovibrionota bacterium FG-1]